MTGGGIDFSAEGIRDVKDQLTDLRDMMLIGAPWEDTRLLTHVLLYLADYAIKVEREEKDAANKGPA